MSSRKTYCFTHSCSVHRVGCSRTGQSEPTSAAAVLQFSQLLCTIRQVELQNSLTHDKINHPYRSIFFAFPRQWILNYPLDHSLKPLKQVAISNAKRIIHGEGEREEGVSQLLDWTKLTVGCGAGSQRANAPANFLANPTLISQLTGQHTHSRRLSKPGINIIIQFLTRTS